MSTITPRTETPDLDFATVDGDTWRLADQQPKNFTMIVVYRGLHCPICKNYLRDLDRMKGEFDARGVEVVVVSSDEKGRAEEAKRDWELENLTIGYGMSIEKAREWGLYISTGRGKTSAGIEEPAIFNEPGLFLVRPDKTLYASNIVTMPFTRPRFKEVLGALDVIIEKDYPARGEA
ncbi:MAG: peroxiredoxin-like family protein [Gammaproteobacteria bacterium]|jgi:peroxiredoxin|nr:peroxiredoxin-like family protein [Gammaproteobacteria bacterium]MDX2459196.1 peroxiredoxin-like family protein [Gammaproteobacteria bacterium]